MVESLITSSQRQLTFAEYLTYDDGTDTKYELVNGYLVAMPNGISLHFQICSFLVQALNNFFAEVGLDYAAEREYGVRTEINSSRNPDICIYDIATWKELDQHQVGVFDFEITPPLVIEVVSTNWQDDYRYKFREYSDRGIPEYWIVDPHRQLIRICVKPGADQGYEYQDFTIGDNITSEIFPQLNLAVASILEPLNAVELLNRRQEQVQLELTAKDQQLAAKDQQLAQKDEQFTIEREKSEQLLAQLQQLQARLDAQD